MLYVYIMPYIVSCDARAAFIFRLAYGKSNISSLIPSIPSAIRYALEGDGITNLSLDRFSRARNYLVYSIDVSRYP